MYCLYQQNFPLLQNNPKNLPAQTDPLFLHSHPRSDPLRQFLLFFEQFLLLTPRPQYHYSGWNLHLMLQVLRSPQYPQTFLRIQLIQILLFLQKSAQQKQVLIKGL